VLQNLLGLLPAILLGAALTAPAGMAVEKPNLSGFWQWNPSKGDFHAAKLTGLTWVIDQKDESLHFSEIAKDSGGKEIKSAFDCTMDGKECSVKLGGHPAKVSFYFNGDALVEIESRGPGHAVTVKKRLHLLGDGKSMNVEMIPVVGTQDAGKMVFEKQ
jgi:hypothetical protein